MKKKIVVEIVCFLFILLYVYAAASKLMIYEGYKMQMNEVSLIKDYADFLVWFIPGSELVISAMLAIGRLRKIGLYAATSLMVLFCVYIGVMMMTTDRLPCSCGGALGMLNWTEHLILNIAFVLMGGVAIIYHRSEEKSKKEPVLA